MKFIAATAFLTFGVLVGAGAPPAAADSLTSLKSACRTGNYVACTRYNQAVINRNRASSPVLSNGYDPFAIVPAVHSERTPQTPSNGAATKSDRADNTARKSSQ